MTANGSTNGVSNNDLPALMRFRASCREFRKHLPTLLELKKKKEENPQAFSEALLKSTFMLMELKSRTRETYLSTDSFMQQVREKKNLMEVHHLKLQNLSYEKTHLITEIQRCKDFTTNEMNMIEFEGGDLPITNDKHNNQQHLDRLGKELSSRKKMSEELAKVEQDDKELRLLNTSRLKFLDDLPEQLQALETSTLPLQKFFTTEISKQIGSNAIAASLPSPLFIIYKELSAYTEASGNAEKFQVSIQSSVQPSSVPPIVFGRKRPRAIVGDTGLSKKRIRRSDSSMAASPAPSPEGSPRTDESMTHLQVSPNDVWILSDQAVVFKITERYSGKDVSVNIRFQLYPKLEIVTAEAIGFPYLVINLFPNDSGEETPRHSNNYKFEMDAKKEFSIPIDWAAKPFSWVQWLAGIYHIERREASVRTIVEQLVKRFRTHLALDEQLAGFSKSTPVIKTDEGPQPRTVMESWKAIDRPEQDIFGFAGISGKSKTPVGSRFFKASFRRDRACLRAVVEVPAEYPIRPPRLIFQTRKPDDEGASYDNDLRAIEVEVNSYYEELIQPGQEAWLLSYQLRHVQSCFDIIGTPAFTAGSFHRARRGKDRRRALVTDPISRQQVHR